MNMQGIDVSDSVMSLRTSGHDAKVKACPNASCVLAYMTGKD